MQLLDLPTDLFVPGEPETEDATSDVTVGLRTCQNGTIVLPVWTTEEKAMAVWLALPSPPPVLRVPAWSTVLDLACRRAAHALYVDPAPDEVMLTAVQVDPGTLDEERLLPLVDDAELWPAVMAHLEAGGIHHSFDTRLRMLWETRRSMGWTEFWEAAVQATLDGQWMGRMVCRACQYQWRSLLDEPPPRCPSCSSPLLMVIRENRESTLSKE